MRTFFVYILASKSRVLYTGVTNDLERRMIEHREKRTGGFTAKYNVNRLVFYEEFPDITQAIEAEKRIKGWVCEENRVDRIEESGLAGFVRITGVTITLRDAPIPRDVILMEP